MASNRKKQDEKHLKILRYLVSQPGNKQCFDCSQRGPTYVNVTIGSFVCTSCSGLLRGLTPPHRVKSISMATFTTEEIESLQTKGNEYCRKVWLALYDSDRIQNTKDEHLVRDFMVAKYEKMLYYTEPSNLLKNGNSLISGQTKEGGGAENMKIQTSVTKSSPITSLPTTSKVFQNQTNSLVPNISNMNLSDPFRVVPTPGFSHKNQAQEQETQIQSSELSFANFENNPIFNSSSISSSSSCPSSKPNSTMEDKYAALKDLDCLMKMQQESPQTQGLHGTSWSGSNSNKSSPSNPFQSDIGNNNVIVNPFRSGLIQQIENFDNSCNNNGENKHNDISLSTSFNPWGANNIWINNTPAMSPNWNEKGNLSVIPGNSNNPFL